MQSMQRSMSTQRLLKEVGGEIAATAALLQGMTLQHIHHTARKGDIDSLGAGRISHVGTAGRRVLAVEALLQLLHQILKKRHDFASI